MTLHHRISGDGERVVVMSGSIGSTTEMWEPQLDALTPHYRVVRCDHPGHGGSLLLDTRTIGEIAREVVAVLDSLSVERFSFCGLSLGGAIGMRLALDLPERVERLVLVATAARIATPEFWEERAETVRSGGLEAIADVAMQRWFTPGFRDVRRYREMLLSNQPEGYARCCEALRDWDVRGKLGGIRVPTLAVAGREDPSTPPSDLEAIVAEIPGARLVTIDDARHLVNVAQPAAFNDALLSHLAL
jgi:3-oxoadipate enol-lactonase